MGEVRRHALPSSGCDNRPGWEPLGVVVNKWGRVDVVWRRLPVPDPSTDFDTPPDVDSARQDVLGEGVGDDTERHRHLAPAPPHWTGWRTTQRGG